MIHLAIAQAAREACEWEVYEEAIRRLRAGLYQRAWRAANKERVLAYRAMEAERARDRSAQREYDRRERALLRQLLREARRV